MLFTVIQFIPLLEEENASHRVELCKKMNANDTDATGDGDCDDDCNDNDFEQDIFLDAKGTMDGYLVNIQQQYIHGACFYEHLYEKKPSPPPKI